MKKFLLLLLLAGAGIARAPAQNPIPSYNTPIYDRANFQELAKSFNRFTRNASRRTVHVVATGSPSGMATVWVYSLDMETVYGPYVMWGGQTLLVEVDNRAWGVAVESEDHLAVDVWISSDP